MKKEKAPDTKLLIMDAAERLFASHGFEATSLRAITSEAGVNLGAVNYHFTSKDALILAVLSRRIRPINEQRLALLTKMEEEAGGEALTVEKILEALFRPPIELVNREPEEGGLFIKLLVNLLAERAAFVKPMLAEEFAENKRRFNEAVRRAVPGLDEGEACWRMHLAMGAFIHAVAHQELLETVSQGKCKPGGIEETLERIVAFCAAGFGATELSKI